jgi:mannose-6-phosphate isomerase-like protein (cupin superfamily)
MVRSFADIRHGPVHDRSRPGDRGVPIVGRARDRHRRSAAPERSRPMNRQSINFAQKFALFSERWQPKIVAEMNDYQFKIVKLQGDFIWHDHRDTDETFIVIEGELRIDFRDGAVHVAAGEMFVVPKGVEHKPSAQARP